ncbi:LOW QUALITY PROTEIN: coiled-coil domain-containing protein 183 [Antrostomus carolinensis]|uniref:LOW QUALITY PROTEIN: coiled-coil domain-containing protein 183 n=1 Tax=Antrostomus carolinensis TaxID=279965 RepID=UPI0010A9859A|nr:LOW QUALITY PROTEIN: coiled-coil domain-containing protein 183 [Antrostomus carolinensis]
MAKQEGTGAQQQQLHKHQALGCPDGGTPKRTSSGSEATVTTESSVGLGDQQGRKAKLSQRVQELRTVISLQEQGRKFFTLSCEEKLNRNRELLPCLREVVHEDLHALNSVQKNKQLTIPQACGAQDVNIGLARKMVEVAQEKLQAEFYDQVKKCNLLLYQLRLFRGGRSRDELQQRLQQLQDAEVEDKQLWVQVQTIRQLENNIEKMITKVHAGQKVTTLYLVVRDALREELIHLPLHLDLLCGMAKLYHEELEDVEIMALDAVKAADIVKKDMAKIENQFLVEREFRYHSLAAQKVHIDRRWLKEASEKHLRAQDRYELTEDFPPLHPQDSLGGTELDAAKSQMEHKAQVTEKMEKAKAAVQCSCIWDIPGRLLAHQRSLVDLEQYVKERKEKKERLKEMLKELELEQAELKFRWRPNTNSCMDVNVVGSRILEEELRMNLQREEARREQMRSQMLRNQELVLEFENGINNLFVRLHGITIPGQHDSVKARTMEEKLQHCQQKLQYLMQRMTDLPPDWHSPDEDNKTFVKVRNFLEKTTMNDPQNLKISLEDVGSRVQDPFDFADKDYGVVLTREDIKKQGLHLIESKKKSAKKK